MDKQRCSKARKITRNRPCKHKRDGYRVQMRSSGGSDAKGLEGGERQGLRSGQSTLLVVNQTRAGKKFNPCKENFIGYFKGM